MADSKRKKSGVVKGTGRAVLLSVLVHLGLFLIAGMLVVFTVVKKQEQQFDPPKATERPKMKLKKPKVRVKKNSRPKSTARIATRSKSTSMPVLDLPEMSGMGQGLGDGISGFDLMPDMDGELSPFGSSFSTGNDLKGYFYDFKRDRQGRPIPMDPNQLRELMHQYLKNDWRNSLINSYYRSPKTLYSTTVCVPTVLSEIAPLAFGEFDTVGYCWAVIYEGILVYPEDITFRLWGVGDKFMAVRVEGETVLFCAYRGSTRSRFSDVWDTLDPKDHTYYFAEARARPSDWITLKANQPKKIKIILGDFDGGLVYHILSVEEKGKEYPYTRAGGGPTFPVFRTGEIPRDILDAICTDLYPGDACLTNGPIFRDFQGAAAPPSPEPKPVPPPGSLPEPGRETREWTTLDGKKTEGRFQALMSDTVILESDRRRPVKIPLKQLADEDREMVEMMCPPNFDINWVKKSRQVPNPPLAPSNSGSRPLSLYDYNFGVRIKQTTVANAYNHDVEVEYFAIGEEIDGNNLILLDHDKESFNAGEYQRDVFEMSGPDVRMKRMAYRPSNPMRGTEYSGYLVTISDKRGHVIAYKASHEFLFEIVHRLKQLSTRNYFNKAGERVYPTGPTEDNRGYGAIAGSG